MNALVIIWLSSSALALGAASYLAYHLPHALWSAWACYGDICEQWTRMVLIGGGVYFLIFLGLATLGVLGASVTWSRP